MTIQKLLSFAILGTAAGLLAPAHAQNPASEGQESHSAHHASGASVLPKIKAEVRRIDAQSGKITLKHGEITNLDMPPMTMVFQVTTPDLLQGLEAGHQVLFTTDKINGAYTVLSIERAP
jgi:Cu(I)/Ag(I) efflux system periplasmic protein CusF